MIGLTPTLSQGFANNILEAKNLLAYRGRVILTLTLIGVLCSFYFAKNYGVAAMVLVTVFFILLERIILIPYYIKKANLDMMRYYKEISPLFIGLVLILSSFLFINNYLPDKNVYVFFGNILCYSMFYFLLFYFLLSGYEKTLFKSMLGKIPFKFNIKNGN